ncbi:fimbrial protein [Burkholderia sp. MSMB1826]|uniref:fimbrial protein n=1 Tax=Burkholderia sp. MSMB1826 TaxID=1637875 RepID=UPI00075CA636|nr:fimbrial protein [Burkholderia sp. MSMB1826]KVL21197.1 fimbrial protein [Burkholderia sp. MSMB1826]
MTKTIISAALAAASIVAMAPAAHAFDGTIDFTGSIVATTCTINGGGSANNFTVALPPVSTDALKAAGSTAGRTPFQLKLTNYQPDTGKVATFFESGPTINTATGRLMVDAGGAEGVEIGLLNDSFQHIAAGAAYNSQNSQVVDITGGAATLNYYAQYESLGTALKAGPANSRVQYTMSYQ